MAQGIFDEQDEIRNENAEHAGDLADAIELVKLAGRRGFRNYPGTGGIWFGNETLAQGRFDDWGLGRAVARILNAVNDGRLVLNDIKGASK